MVELLISGLRGNLVVNRQVVDVGRSVLLKMAYQGVGALAN